MNARKIAALRVIVLSILGLGVRSGYAATVINEQFNNLNDPFVTDLSALNDWSGSGPGVSEWTVGPDPGNNNVQSLSVAPAAIGAGGNHANYGWCSLDFRLPTPVQHNSNTITVTFDARVNKIYDKSNGERNRFIIGLMNNYPTTPLVYSTVTPDQDINSTPYGSPTYHLRIRPGITQPTSFLQYGGEVTKTSGTTFTDYGNTWEFSGVSDPNGPKWYPGFNATVAPNALTGNATAETSPGASGVADYPSSSEMTLNPIFLNDAADSLLPVEYKYVITPTDQQVWIKRASDAGFIQLGDMLTPLTSSAPAYTYYGSFDALRLFFNNAGDNAGDPMSAEAYFSNLKVDVTSDASAAPVPAPPALVVVPAGLVLTWVCRRRFMAKGGI